MLKKSTKASIVMSGIAFLSIMVTLLFWELLSSNSATTIMTKLQSVTLGNIFIILPIILILLILPGAFIIRNWSDAHFGKEGAIRWVIFGIIYGCIAQGLRFLVPSNNLDRSFMSFAIEKGISIGLGLVIFFVSYFLAFRLLKRKI